MASTHGYKNLPSEDLIVLARHLSRVSGFISMRTLMEYFPDLDVMTAQFILESLCKKSFVQEGKHGVYTFMETSGEIETGDLAEELRVLEALKNSALAENSENSSSEVFRHQGWGDTMPVKAESDEEVCITQSKRSSAKLNQSECSHGSISNHGKSRRRLSDSGTTIVQIPLDLHRLRKWSLEESSSIAGGLGPFLQSTPENRSIGDLATRTRSTSRRRGSSERSPSGNSHTEVCSGSSERSPSLDLNKSIHPEYESLNTEYDPALFDPAASITSSWLLGSAEESSHLEPNKSMTAEMNYTFSDLIPGLAALNLDSSGNSQLTTSELDSGDSLNAPDARIQETEDPQEVTAVDATVDYDAGVDRDPGPKPSPVSNKFHRTKQTTGEGVDDPCKALEDFCRSLQRDPPAYSVTFMQAQKAYFCTLYVGKQTFLSYPTLSKTEESAKEVAAEKAVMKFGITARMVATKVFPTPRRNVQKNRIDSR